LKAPPTLRAENCILSEPANSTAFAKITSNSKSVIGLFPPRIQIGFALLAGSTKWFQIYQRTGIKKDGANWNWQNDGLFTRSPDAGCQRKDRRETTHLPFDSALLRTTPMVPGSAGEFKFQPC